MIQNNGNIEYLNVGCGPVRFDSFLNLDMTKGPMIDLDVQGDIGHLPFKNEVFKGIIASHVLEHLKQFYHEFALSEFWRVLKPEGKVYIEVPDLLKTAEFFVENYKGMRDMWYAVIYGRQAYEGDAHYSGFTADYLTEILFGNGFGNLKWAPPSPVYTPYRTQPVLTVTATKQSDFDRWSKGFV